jgi:hypothetical protein
MIRDYLTQLNASLASYQWVRSVQVLRCDILETEQLQILTYRFRVFLMDNSLLELMERVVSSKHQPGLETTTYRFHWQDRNGALIRRWDCAPHFPLLPAFPHHIHLRQEYEVLQGRLINALEALVEIDGEMSNGKDYPQP